MLEVTPNADMELRFHQCIKDAWRYVNAPFASDSAKSKVGAVALAEMGTCSRIDMIFALQTAWTFIHGCGDERLIQEARALRAYDFPELPAPLLTNDHPVPHPGGYYVVLDHEQTCDHKPTLAEARLAGQALCDAEILPSSFPIQNGDGEHIEDILRSDGRDLSAQVADFNSLHGGALSSAELQVSLPSESVTALETVSQAIDSSGRADRIDITLAAYAATLDGESDPQDRTATRLACALADMRHWCAKHGVDFEEALASSETYFSEERESDFFDDAIVDSLDGPVAGNALADTHQVPDVANLNIGRSGNRLLDAVEEMLEEISSWNAVHESHLTPMREAVVFVNESHPQRRTSAVASLAGAAESFISKVGKQGWAIHDSHLAGVRMCIKDFNALLGRRSEGEELDKARNALSASAIYLWSGFARTEQVTGSELGCDGSHFAVVDRVAHLASIVDLAIQEADRLGFEYSGPINYEVTEPLGVWLREEQPNSEENFRVKLTRRLEEYFERDCSPIFQYLQSEEALRIRLRTRAEEEARVKVTLKMDAISGAVHKAAFGPSSGPSPF